MSSQMFVAGLGIGPEADDAWFASGLGAALVEAVDTVPVATLPGTSLTRMTFMRGASSTTVDAPAERRWVLTAAGEAGEATIQLPRDSAAARSTYINHEGGSTVRIHSEGGCGEWFGIIADVDNSDPSAITITAYQPGKLLGRRQVLRQGVLRNVSAGFAATVVLRESLSGVRGLSMPDAPFEGGVIGARDFDPNGDAWGALTALMDASGAEVDITTDGEVRWIGPLAAGRRYDTLLIDGANFQDVSYAASIQNRVAEVTAGEGPTQYTARRGDAAHDGWPAQVTVSGNAQTAQSTLEARSEPEIVISGGVTSPQWDIREGDFVQVLVPSAGFGGRMHRCRVLARSLADSDHLMRLELQVMQPVAPTTISGVGAGARQKPPQRASAGLWDGSFAQQLAMVFLLLRETHPFGKRLS